MNQEICKKCKGPLVYLSLTGPEKRVGYTEYVEIFYCPECDDEELKHKELKRKLKEFPIKKRVKSHILKKRETLNKWWQSGGGGGKKNRIRTRAGRPIFGYWSEVSDEILIKYYGQGKETAKPELKLNDWMNESDRKNKIDLKKTYRTFFERTENLKFIPPTECQCGGDIVATYLNETTPEINYVCLVCYGINEQLLEEPDFGLGKRHPTDPIPDPPPCICGHKKYTIYDEYTPSRGYRKVARCTKSKCPYSRIYYFDLGQWTDVHSGFKVKIRKTDVWSKTQIEEEKIEETSSLRMEKEKGSQPFEDRADELVEKELKRTEKDIEEQEYTPD